MENKNLTKTKTSQESLVPTQLLILQNPQGEHYDEYVKLKLDNGGGSAVIMLSGSTTWNEVSGKRTISGTGLIIIKGDLKISNLTFSEDFTGYLISLSSSFIRNLMIDFSSSSLIHQMKDGPAVKSISDTEIKIYKQYIYLITQNISLYPEDGAMTVTHYLVKAFFYKILVKFVVYKSDEIHNQKERIAKDFLRLANQDGAKYRNLDYYAKKLCVTKKYLPGVESKNTGKPSHYWVEEATMNKARYLLKSTMLSICQISDALNFPTPGDFSRFFKRNEKITPLQFRKMSIESMDLRA